MLFDIYYKLLLYTAALTLRKSWICRGRCFKSEKNKKKHKKTGLKCFPGTSTEFKFIIKGMYSEMDLAEIRCIR